MATAAENYALIQQRINDVLQTVGPTYRIGDEMYDKNGYLKTLLSESKNLLELMMMEQGPIELVTKAVT